MRTTPMVRASYFSSDASRIFLLYIITLGRETYSAALSNGENTALDVSNLVYFANILRKKSKKNRNSLCFREFRLKFLVFFYSISNMISNMELKFLT